MNYRPNPQYGYYLRLPAQKTEYVKWNDSYKLGIKQIDDQHKGLLGLVNDLLNHTAGNKEDEFVYFKEIIGQIVDYSKIHFVTEEKIMLATQFPGYSVHKMAHDKFILTVVQNVKDFEAGKRLVLINFSNYLKNWILGHIAIVDVKYSEHFKRVIAERAALSPA